MENPDIFAQMIPSELTAIKFPVEFIPVAIQIVPFQAMSITPTERSNIVLEFDTGYH